MFHVSLRPSRTNFVFHQITRELWKFECLVCIRVIHIHVIRSLGDMLQHKCLESEDGFGCGAKGHQKERCPTRAGAEIRKLRKLVRTQQAISKPDHYKRQLRGVEAALGRGAEKK